MRLIKPELSELWFREALLSDSETMSYNAKWGGTIRFPQSKWAAWYVYWLKNHEGKRFYRYIADEKNRYVGEAAYHYDAEKKVFLTNIIVMSRCRGNGYGTMALRLLCDHAKAAAIDALYDNIAIDNRATKIFIDNGFVEEYRTDEIIMLKKIL